jgi:hypothetical protein
LGAAGRRGRPLDAGVAQRQSSGLLSRGSGVRIPAPAPFLNLISVHVESPSAYAGYAESAMAANRIRELRLQKAEVAPRAFAVAALAQRLGVDASTLRSWERGSHRPTQCHLRALSPELGVSAAELVQQSES